MYPLLKKFLILILCAGYLCQSRLKPLTTLLRSSWGYTPFLLEACEFLWVYDEDVFWTFVNSSEVLSSTNQSDQEVYNSAIDFANELLPPAIYNAFLFSLSLHVYSPAVQLFQQLSVEAKSKLGSPEDCRGDEEVFVDVGGQLVCSVGSLQQQLKNGETRSRDPPRLYKFDHTFPCMACTEVPVVILYGQLGTAEFADFHHALLKLATRKEIVYTFRHYYKKQPSQQSVLSGYGVQLTVKSTEYKAVDDTQVEDNGEHLATGQEEDEREVAGFRFSTLESRYPDKAAGLKEFEAHLLQGTRELPELKLWQLQDLGFQAAQRVTAAGQEFALEVLKDLSQNLPTQAKSLYKVQVDKNLRKEINANQKALGSIGVSPGQSVLFLNGIVLQPETNIFQLFELLLSETVLLDRLSALGIEPVSLSSLLSLPLHGPEASQVVLDVRSKAVVFVNDLEKDSMYRSWAKSLKEFLRPTYPGMLRQIARNAFNIVFLLDPLSTAGIEMVEYVKLFLDHMVPARLGLVLVPEAGNEGAAAVCQGFAFLSAKVSPREALRWLVKVQEGLADTNSVLRIEDVSELFEKVFSKALKEVSVSEVFSAEWDTYRKEADGFYLAKGFSSLPQVLVNGVQLNLKEEDIESAIVTRMQYQTFEIQQAVFNNKLKDKDNVYDFFLERPHVLKRVNRHVLAKSQVVDLSSPVLSDSGKEGAGVAARLASAVKYLSQPESEFITKELSVWVVCDLATLQGRQMVLDAVQFLLKSGLLRVAVLHHGTPSVLSHAIQAVVLKQYSSASAFAFLKALLDKSEESVDIPQVIDIATSCQLNPDEIIGDVFSSELNLTHAEHVLFARNVLKLDAGQNMLVCNGKLVGPLADGEVFGEEDWSMLVGRESQAYATNMVAMVDTLSIRDLSPDDDTSSYRSDLVMKLASLLRSRPKRNRIPDTPKLLEEHSVVHLPPLEPDLYLTIMAVLDPLSADTQRFAPLLQTLHAAFSIDLTVYLNPQPKLSQLPLSSFYRYVLQPELSFNENGSLQESAVAVFSDLPTSPLFTLSLDVPHSWLVEPVFSPHDLDNIHLAQLPDDSSIHAEFVLEHILVEGQCFDVRSEQPTPGLQFVLGTASQPELFDTIVMANLGYFQLKAGPGAWLMRLREGRSQDLYNILSYSTSDSNGRMEEMLGDEIAISVGSFGGAGVTVKVGKKEGMENMELLEAPEDSIKPSEGEGEDLWSSLSNLIHSSGNLETKNEPEVAVNETINVFSIASGHLYERFLRIMMLSVLNHTQNPVKFWFLKNFLSPTFKSFIPAMAGRYGFEYELVEYKWPRWLHAQTQKQRLIWGYKILFLDVLFPLSVKKIIFVDADQIVRADLKELLEMPLEGAPYAYTPFCDSRPDMAGFRFWEKGYWKGHLGNRRYHISALYVVDLVAFRRLAAGDRLRGQYQALSQDPNSLSNLDQDLPNNMIHSVPIKSLPQEWLWCETWCSQETKPQAKTIDLCNNPLTKEPKLQSAMRIVPEWTTYDDEIKALWNREGKDSASSSLRTLTNKHTEL